MTALRVFLYEHITATITDEASSLFIEGRAMHDALAADIERIDGVACVRFDRSRGFDACLNDSDAVWLIAPEFDGILCDLAVTVERSGKRLLGPTSEAIALTSDKLALFRHWQAHGVPTPKTVRADLYTFADGNDVIIKPIDGAGSTATTRVRSRSEWDQALASGPSPDRFIVQPYRPWRSVSLAFIDGRPLWPMTQTIDAHAGFAYAGGESIAGPAEMVNAIITTATRAVACVPGLHGYVGVDLLIDESNFENVEALEINPRLTTSYIGLRKMSDTNLAESVVFSKPVSMKPRLGVVFTSNGDYSIREEQTD